jgi:uncharacterized membrane protein
MFEVTLAPIAPWPVVLLTAVALIAFVLVTYRLQTASLTPSRRRILLACKLLAAGLLIFAMLRPAVQFTETDENTAQLLILTDTSRSMTTLDGPANVSRWQAAQQDWQRLTKRREALGEKLTIRRFEFDRDLRPATETPTPPAGDFTALGVTLESVLREARQERTIGVLFLTDGAQRAVPPFDVDPLLAARKLAAESVPLYPVGYGASAVSSAAADLRLADLAVDPVVFERKKVPLKVQLRGLGAARQKTKVRVLIEDRGSLPPGQSGPLVPVARAPGTVVELETTLRGDDDTQTLELSFIPQRPGELKLAVEVDPLEGEVLTRNNRIETVVTVRQGGLRVAYFDTARPEQKYLRMVNGSDKIQLDWIEIRRGKFRSQTRIPPTLFERGAYDVYLLGDVPTDVFTPALLQQLADRVQEGAGLLMLGGLENYAAGGYGATPLADLLPVQLAAAGGGGPTADQVTGPQPMVPTERGLQRYVMQLTSADQNRARWQTLAPLVGATILTPKNDLVEVWAQTTAGVPLLLATEVGRARVAAFGGDTTYQWVLHNQGTEHQRFWRQMILWLARKEADTNQTVWAKVEPRNFVPGARVPLEFGARNDAGQPVTDVEFTVTVTRPDGQVVSVAPRQEADRFSADFTESSLAGDYWVRVTARRGGNQIGIDATTRFIVDPRDLELDQPNADYETLGKLAEITGGQLLKPEDLDEFLERLASLKLDDLTRVTIWPLWDNVWLLLVFVTVLTVEWALRKKWGLA